MRKPVNLPDKTLRMPILNIQHIRVATPCHVDWNEMTGSGRMRHCCECNLNVYNLSEMTENEIHELLTSGKERICGRLYYRADGTILTRDCPRGLRAAARSVSRVAAGILAALMSAGLVFGATKPQTKQSVTGTQSQCKTPGLELVVLDPGDAVIENAKVALSTKNGKTTLVLDRTNDSGKFSWAKLPSGKYTLTITSPGFREFTTSVSLQEGRLFSMKVKLPLAAAKTEVIVKRGPSVLQGVVIEIPSPTTGVPLPPASATSGRPQPMRY